MGTITTAPPDRRGHVPVRPLPRWRGALAGLLAAGAALGVAELVAGLIRGTTGPVLSVGEFVIDHVPSSVKEFAVKQFGTNDKPMLSLGIFVILGIIALLIGMASVRRLIVGVVGIAAFGAVGIATAVSRPSAGATSALPALIGTGVALVVLVWLVRGHLRPRPEPHVASRLDGADPEPAGGFGRRRFLVGAAATAAAAAIAGGVGKALQKRFNVNAARQAVQLPAPASPAAAVPDGVDLGKAGITPFMTRNDDFYRVDTALTAPQVAPEGWRLRIHGMVDKELTFTYQDLLDRKLVERDLTLVCVSNEVGGPYAGNARWLGVPLAELLDEAGAHPDADQLVSRSVDGWSAGTPTAAIRDGRDALVALGMNGEPLPVNHGFPARLVVPGLYGFTSATKWLVDLELTTFDAYRAYWVERGWAQIAPVKTLTRIDAPRGLANIPAGRTAIGGMAWAVHRGVTAVEVKIDDGPWQPATMGKVPSADTWCQWFLDWDATPGSHTIQARSTDATGTVQTEDRAKPIPDGASGWHSIVVLVA